MKDAFTKELNRFIKNILLIVNLVAVAALLGCYFSQYIPPDKWWAPSVLGLFYPYLLAVNLFFIILWLIIKPRHIFYSLFVILAGWGVFSRFLQISGKTSPEADISVVSYNVKNFTGKGSNPSHELAEIIKGFLKENEPDIICLQEVKLRTNKIFNLEATRGELPNIRHYQYARAGSTMGSVTMTSYPIVKMEEIRFEKSGNIAICTDVVIRKDTVRIFNVHLQSYRIDPDRYSVIESPRISQGKEMREYKELALKYKKAMEMRAVQARLIRKKIEESPYPVIVCGDFNDTPSSYAYMKTKGNLRDAFVASGKGIGQTYVGKLPSFRIDYILHSRFFKSYNFTIHNIPYSDHLPISCDLAIR